ncbi:putative P450 monooxygenase [Dendryphion nanum]|uniref:P450 monooxygenase n=1 Tax=Dendryphion nanum TaxID=256645 RepID=A0A9P9DVS4_9PLEO|nr:putative P450 monooxygenase [Dendryphion nanum]
MGFLNDHPMAATAIALVTVIVGRFLYNFAYWRLRMRNLPGPPHSLLFGHIIPIGKLSMKLPQRAHPHYQPLYLTQEYNLPSIFYMDLYPLDHPVMVVMDPEAATEIAEKVQLNKHGSLRNILAPLMGHENLIVSNGAFWKQWRAIFNPGFSVQHLMTQVSTIVDCVETFVDILDEQAVKNKVFRLEEDATKVTIDIIGKVVCDHDFKSLTTNCDFVENMRNTLGWMTDIRSINPFHLYNPLRPILFKYYKNRMDSYIGKVLDDRFTGRVSSSEMKTRKRTGVDLALEAWAKESGQDVDSKTATMDPEFRKHAINQLETLMFAGHDTTASTICYCYYLLHQNPSALTNIRKELDDIFGSNVPAGDQLKKNPYLINQCEYTHAVVRETLRLWNPASTARVGNKDYFIRDKTTGEMLPTEGFLVWIPSMSMHRDPRYWTSPSSFQPERFLSENADKLTPNVWRPFEKGPRNCIGQELAYIELKIILAMTIREFDIRGAYEELGALNEDGSLWANDASFKKGPQTIFGDEPAYQILLAAAKPREGMPARVKRREQD